MKIKRRNRIIVLLLTIIMIFNITAISCIAINNEYNIYCERLNIDNTDYYKTPEIYLYGAEWVTLYTIMENEDVNMDLYVAEYDYIIIYGTCAYEENYYNSVSIDYWNNNEYFIESLISLNLTEYDQYFNVEIQSGNNIHYTVQYIDDEMYNIGDYDNIINQNINMNNGDSITLYLQSYYENTIELYYNNQSESTSESTYDTVTGSPIPTEILNIDQATMTFMNNTTGIYITLGCILLLVACAIVITLIRRE